MHTPYQAAQAVEVLPSEFPIPGMGVVPVNAFVIKAKEPVMIVSSSNTHRTSTNAMPRCLRGCLMLISMTLNFSRPCLYH